MIVLVSLLAVVWAGIPFPVQEGGQPILIEVRTELGDFLMEVYPDRAAVTVANFLRYVDEGYFDGGRFHRTVREDNQPDDSIRIAVIQGDLAPRHRSARFPAIPLERTNESGLSHRDGAVSMARGGPNTATSSFFICVGDQPELDFGGKRNLDGQGFAAFGRVVEGMEVVRAINAAPARGQNLDPPVAILGVSRRKSDRPGGSPHRRDMEDWRPGTDRATE